MPRDLRETFCHYTQANVFFFDYLALFLCSISDNISGLGFVYSIEIYKYVDCWITDLNGYRKKSFWLDFEKILSKNLFRGTTVRFE